MAVSCSPYVPEIGKRPSKGPLTCGYLVGDTGFEPVTSSVSRKRATTAPIARAGQIEVETGFEPVYAALQAAASPLGHSTIGGGKTLRADDRPRTGDLNLGKVALYQLSYIRASIRFPVWRARRH